MSQQPGEHDQTQPIGQPVEERGAEPGERHARRHDLIGPRQSGAAPPEREVEPERGPADPDPSGRG